jgi:serine/threonine-protein kinase
MATVELALQISAGGFERLVALKRVRPHLVSSDEIEAMFLEEARIAARLNHPNLIHAYEVGHDEVGAFLAMEYLSGQTYSHVLARVGLANLDLRVALETLIATLDGLECVHGLRDIGGRHMALVHRDISPSNLFLTYTGQVKVLDFGIAKARLSSIQTQVGVLKGKIAYMAPEQASGASLDARADLYAVGVMLWEAVAGRRRWADTPDAVVLTHLLSGAAPLSPLAAERGLPALADAVCAKALASDPAARFQSASEFRTALEQLALELGPRPSPRALGEYVIDAFAVERAQVEQEIERRLDERERETGLSTVPHDTAGRAPTPPPSLSPSRESVHQTRPVDVKPRAPLVSPVTTQPESLAVAVSPPRTRTLASGRTLAGAGLAGLALVGVAAWLGLHRSSTPLESSAGSSGTAATALPPPPAPVASAPSGATPAPVPLTTLPLEASTPKPSRAGRPHVAPPKKAAPKASGLALDRKSPW